MVQSKLMQRFFEKVGNVTNCTCYVVINQDFRLLLSSISQGNQLPLWRKSETIV